MENKISNPMPEEKYQRVQKLIDALYEELDTVVLPLSEDDKKEMQRLGAKTMEFVRNSVKHAKLTPELVPSYIDVKEMEKDLLTTEQMRDISLRMEKLSNLVGDTYVLAGSELYDNSLIFYHSVKGGVKANIPGAEEAYEDLSVRFPGRPSKAGEEQEPAV
ncbi:MAG: hypothetical protein ACOCTM_03870 [Bacteroidota bacterium]